MKHSKIQLFVTAICLQILLVSYLASAQIQPASETVILSPISISYQGGTLNGEEGLIFVPENRANEANSKKIAVHFYRFVSEETNKQPPVFFLPGGPGEAIGEQRLSGDPQSNALLQELLFYRRSRDFIVVNQRGNPRAPGVQPALQWSADSMPLDSASTEEATTSRIRKQVAAGIDYWSSRGVDLAGYDIINITQDVDSIRQSLGYDSICLRGTSFGCQHALAYLRLFPDKVDRLLLSAIEPLDHTYDSPAGIMAALARLESKALSDQALVDSLPDDLVKNGLLESYRRVVEELEATPRIVTFPASNRKDAPVIEVSVGADDLRRMLLGFLARTRRESLSNWPSYVRDVVNGDLRMAAWSAYENHRPRGGGVMIGRLIDNSLGISESRRNKLADETKEHWLGDLNISYNASNDLTPTPTVPDSFRAMSRTKVPVLMVHGDVDFSTPLSNANELLPFLENGHLLVVGGGTHSALRELIFEKPAVAEKVLDFMNIDFSTTSAKEYFRGLPKQLDLEIEFRVNPQPLFDD